MSDFVRVVEVSPRDGLQNEAHQVETHTKVELIKRLDNAGLPMIEATGFVSPKWVPQLADAVDVIHALPELKADITALVPNQRGMMAAIDCGLKEIAVFTAASESFTNKNINCSIEESLQRFDTIIQLAQQHNIKVRAYISCVLGCPYEGDIQAQVVADIAQQLAHSGCYEISLGDTIGTGNPRSMTQLITCCTQQVAVDKLAVHCHDTYGQALANVYAALEQGVRTVDASVAGLGGCPYAPGASGNLSTEDLVYMLHGCGYETGIDLHSLVQTGQWISQTINRTNYSKVGATFRAN